MKKTSKSDPASRTTSVAQLKARLSEYLRFVKAGGEVVVSDRGRPVARLVPVGGELAGSARLKELAAGGLARLPTHAISAGFFERDRPVDRAGRMLDIVLEERAAGR